MDKIIKKCVEVDLGKSDIAEIILRDGDIGVTMVESSYPGHYTGFISDNEKIQIPDEFQFVESYADWLWIYDDCTRRCVLEAEHIDVYHHDFTFIFLLKGEVRGMYAMKERSFGMIDTYNFNTEQISTKLTFPENEDWEPDED